MRAAIIAIAAAGALSAGAASAQSTFTRQNFNLQIMFGDSVSDSGNSYVLTNHLFPAQGAAPPVGSANGRFSNGPMWPDILAANLGLSSTLLTGGAIPSTVGGINFAVGGSTSGNAPLDTQTLSAPGAITQVQEYLTFTVNGTVAKPTSRTLYTIFTGGNDYTGFIGSLTPGVTANLSAATIQAQVNQVQTNIATSINLLANAGAKTILVANQFDIGVVPLFRDPSAYGLPADALPLNAAAIGTQLTDANNAGMAAFLSRTQSQTGVRLIQVDVNALYRDAFYNPSAYGFTNVTSSCVGLDFATPPTGAPSCSTTDQARRVMFWQATHPGLQTQLLLAELMNGTLQTVLAGPQTVAVQSRVGLLAAESRRELAADQVRQLPENGAAVITDVSYGEGDRDQLTDRTGYSYSQYLLTLGVGYGLDENVRVGAYFSYGANVADLTADAGTVDLQTFGFHAFAGYRKDNWLGAIQLGAIRDDYIKINRASGFDIFPTARSNTLGWTYTIDAEGNYAANLNDSLTVGPVIGLHAARINIDGYGETGTRLLDLAVAAHGVSSVVGTIGGRLGGVMPIAGMTVATRIDLAYERELAGGNESILTSLSDGQTASVISGPGGRDVLQFGAGVDVNLSTQWTSSLVVHQTLMRADGSDTSVRLQALYHF